MYRHSQKMHRGAQKRKNSWKAKRPTQSTNSGEGEAITDGPHEVVTSEQESQDQDTSKSEAHPLDRYDWVNFSVPQLGSQRRLVSENPYNILRCLLIRL